MTDPRPPFTQDELLDFVQGKAEPDLAARIEQARGTDTALAAELALMEGLKPALALGDANPPGELGWRRLEAEIARTEAAPRPAAANTSGGRLVMWKAAAVFLGIAALGQAAYLFSTPADREPVYQTATQGVDAPVLALRFQPTATEAEIRALLQSAEARLVDGPGASGLYRVAFETAEALDRARPLLAASAAVDAVIEE